MILREKSDYYHDTRTVSVNGQTNFTLSRPPSRPDSVTMFPINGTELLYGTDFTVTGKIVTYIGSVPFSVGDKVLFKYYR